MSNRHGSILGLFATARKILGGECALLCLAIASIGCSPRVNSNFSGGTDAHDYLSGRILPLTGFLARNESWDVVGLAHTAYASTCDYRDIRVHLHSLDASGNPSVAPLQTTELLDAEARFRMSNPSSIGVTANQLQSGSRFLIRVTGCARAEIRSVLTQLGDFDVTASMALVGMLTQGSVALRSSLHDLSNDDLSALVKKLSATISDYSSPEAAYAALDADAALKDQFESAFGRQFVVADLADVQPQIVSTTWPVANIPENSTTSYFVGASHWNPNYTIRYLWKLDGVSVSTSSAFNYVPGKNAQGPHQLALYVGPDNGSGGIDTNKPYYYETKTVEVLNTVLPTAPDLSVAGNVLSVSNPSVTVALNTGTAMANCQSFSKMAITVDDALVPDDSEFSFSCTSVGSQNVSLALNGSTDGQKTVRLWTKDSSGAVSIAPSVLSLVLDREGPVSVLSAAPSSLSNATSFSFVFSAVDAHGTLAGFECQVDNGGYSSCVSPKSVSGISAGSHTFSVRASDTLGNVGSAVSVAWNTDLSSPTVTVSSAPSGVVSSSSASIAFSGADTGGGAIDRFECKVDSAAYANCVSPISLASLSDGSHTVLIRAVDTAGNVSAVSTQTWIVDSIAPAVSVSSPIGAASTIYAGGQTLEISWTATDAHLGATPIQLEYSVNAGSTWAAIGSARANSGSYSWTMPTIDSPDVKIRVTATDDAGNSAYADSSGVFTVDSTPPELSSGGMIVNAGESNSTANSVPVSFQGTDALTKIQAFCLKYNDSVLPSSGHSCWRLVTANPPNLTPATTLNVSNYYYQLGFSSGAYNIYVWLKDAAGNISGLSAAGAGTLARDRAIVNYIPGTPPVVSDLLVVNKDDPSSPIDVANDAQVAAGGSVYIKWRATDAEALGTNPISIYYTTDEVTYTLIATDLPNSATGGCTVNHAGTTIDDQATGCYVWAGGNPAEAFRIRVKATDVSGNATVSGSSYMNLSSVNFLAGNTDPGLGGSARSAMFFSNVNTNGGGDQGSFAVAKNGTVYFRDIKRGILKVDPQTGNQTLMIPTTGAFTGENVDIANATLRYPIRLTLDAQDRLLVYDYDRIRRIDTTVTPQTIRTLIGGGSSTSDTTTASAIQITAVTGYNNAGGGSSPFFSLPNGDIYFQSESFDSFAKPSTIHRIRVYHASDSSITSIRLSGTGDPYNGSQNIGDCSVGSYGVTYDTSTSALTSSQASLNHSSTNAACTHTGMNNFYSVNFDPISGVRASGGDPVSFPVGAQYNRVVGKNGKLYGISTPSARLYSYDQATKTWSVLAGTGTLGACADNTLATACAMNPYDIYVTAQDQVYFIDRGKIRIIDGDGRVQTIMGQGLDFGDGASPLSARLGQVNYFSTTDDDRVILVDSFSFLMREFSLGLGTLQTIAGNGSNGTPNTSAVATQNPLFLNFSGGTIDAFQVDPSTAEVYMLRGPSAVGRLDRTTSKFVDVVGGTAQPWKTADGQIGSAVSFLSTYAWIAGFGDSTLMISKANYNGGQVDVYLKAYDSSDSFRQYHFGGYDGVSAGWAANGSMTGSGALPTQFTQYDSFDSKWLIPDGSKIRKTDGATISTLTTAPRSFSAWYYDRTNNLSVNRIFYCSGGKLYQWNINTSVETLLALPSTMSCRGYRLFYHPTRNRLIFIYSQNGLNGIAEYLLP